MKICVFCSSSNAVNDAYFDAADKLGLLIAQEKHTLVYGGANVGLMEHVAKTVSLKNAPIIGVIPQKIHDKVLSSSLPDEMIITKTMDERKRKMRELSDAFIALPGGFGTLEEILEVITLKQLEYHHKPIVFINTNNFYGHLIQQFEHSYAELFAKEHYRKIYAVVNSPEEAMDYINNYEHQESSENKWFIVPEK